MYISEHAPSLYSCQINSRTRHVVNFLKKMDQLVLQSNMKTKYKPNISKTSHKSIPNNQWSKIHVHRYVTGHTCNFFDICHISNTKYSGTFLIRRTKEPGKCVGLYRMSEYSGLIYLTEILWDHHFLSDPTGCRKTQVSECTSSIVLIIIG